MSRSASREGVAEYPPVGIPSPTAFLVRGRESGPSKQLFFGGRTTRGGGLETHGGRAGLAWACGGAWQTREREERGGRGPFWMLLQSQGKKEDEKKREKGTDRGLLIGLWSSEEGSCNVDDPLGDTKRSLQFFAANRRSLSSGNIILIRLHFFSSSWSFLMLPTLLLCYSLLSFKDGDLIL